jgi:chromosomal replication initiator protein
MHIVWDKTLDLLQQKVGKNNVETWIKPIRFLALRDETLHLEVPSTLFRDWLTGNLLKPVEETLALILGYPAQVRLHVNAKAQQELFPQMIPEQPDNQPRLSPRGGLIPNYTFATFVVGAGNQFAHAAAKAVVSSPAERYNPLFIYGGVGLGKTHLVNALGHELLHNRAATQCFYVSSESFTNELISSLRRDKMEDFKGKFRKADVLIVDDVQFLSGRERTQEEFFHTFNSIHDNHKQIVLTSDKFPNEIKGLEDRLRNRFEWGLIADIQPPDLETRVAILQKKAQLQKIVLPYEVAMFIAVNVTSNIRELEGGLTRLGAFASISHTPITVELAHQVLHNLLKDKKKEISVEAVQKAVSKYYGLGVGDITSKKRSHLITLPRQVAMYLCRKLTQTSYPMIGLRFGGKDHTTALHAFGNIERRLKEDAELRATMERIECIIHRQRG